MFTGTIWSLLPPILAIVLALITKEVYSSLFLGILVGALLYSGGNFEGTVNHIFSGGMIAVCWDRSRFLYVCTVSSMDGIYRDL